MRVVHIGHAPLGEAHPDFGRIPCHPGSWVVNHCAAQKGAGVDVEMITQVPGGSAYYRDVSRGFPIHYVPVPNRLRAATLFYFDARKLGRFAHGLQPDLVHAHGTEESYALAAEVTGKPFVITAQGCYFIINREMPPRLLSRERIVEFTENLALKRAKHVIAKSSYIGRELQTRFPHLEVHEIPNTFDAALLNIPLDRKRNAGSIAFVGTITPRKGLHLLAEALRDPSHATRHTPHLCLHIFGNRGTGASDYEQSTINDLKSLLGDRLHLHGVVPAVELPNLLADFEILVAPSLEEMFGNQVIEALLVGTWPVVSTGTAMEENVRRIGAGTVFTNGDAHSLAEVIPEAFASLGAWLRADTRSAVNSWIGPDSVARAHVELYRLVS